MASSSPSRPVTAAPTSAPTRPGRRRQRSVRVTVAVLLLSLATLAVVVALPTQSAVWLSVAAVLSLACGWAAARIVYTELAQSRREAAADRAAQAQAYRTMFSERASEHAEFTSAMTERLVRRDKEIVDLENAVVAAQQRAMEAETRVQRESRRANDAQEQVAALQEEVAQLQIRKAEEADELASWDAALLAQVQPGVEAVVDLMAWEEKVSAGAQGGEGEQQKHA